MINFAHRGFKGQYPENTMLAFRKAIEAGADGIELDVHLTKDNELVIIHDEKLDRTSDGSGLVKDKTLAELKKLNLSKLYPDYQIQEIPTLAEYFDFAKDLDIISNIELKNSIIDYQGIEKEVCKLINDFGIKDKIIISSFNHDSLVRVKEIDKNISCGVLESSRLYKPWEYVKELGMEYYHPLNFVVDKKVVENFYKNNIGLNIWFAASFNDYGKYLDFNPQGLITDHPNKLRELLEQKPV